MLRKLQSTAPWITGPALIGVLIGHGPGLVAGLVVGGLYVVIAAFGGDKVPSDVFGARLMDTAEALNVPELVDKYAERAGITAPSLYVIAIDEPNVLVWASSAGRGSYTRIGVPPGLEDALAPGEVEALMALAVARVASGEAAVLTFGASLAGLALQPFLSRAVNATLGVLRRDPDTRLTPVGGAMVTLLAPASRLSLRGVMPEGTLEWSDAYAARMLGDSVLLASALGKLASAGPATDTGKIRAYNPGLVPMFLVSPYEKLNAVADAVRWPASVVSWIAQAAPTVVGRTQKLMDMAGNGPGSGDAGNPAPSDVR